MKKLSLSISIMFLVIGSALAQQATTESIVQQEVAEAVPQAVLDAVEKSKQGLKFQKKAAVMAHRNTATEKQYVAEIRSQSSNGRSSTIEKTYYNADGSVASFQINRKNCALPKIALRTIGKAYNGWLLVSTKGVVKKHGEQNLIYYKAVLQNGNKKEQILLNERGQIVKNKKALKADSLLIS